MDDHECDMFDTINLEVNSGRRNYDLYFRICLHCKRIYIKNSITSLRIVNIGSIPSFVPKRVQKLLFAYFEKKQINHHCADSGYRHNLTFPNERNEVFVWPTHISQHDRGQRAGWTDFYSAWRIFYNSGSLGSYYSVLATEIEYRLIDIFNELQLYAFSNLSEIIADYTKNTKILLKWSHEDFEKI